MHDLTVDIVNRDIEARVDFWIDTHVEFLTYSCDAKAGMITCVLHMTNGSCIEGVASFNSSASSIRAKRCAIDKARGVAKYLLAEILFKSAQADNQKGR
jgi:hypothetical protein